MQLPAIQSTTGRYLILDLSDVHELVDIVGVGWESEAHRKHLETVLSIMVGNLSGATTGIIIGPEIGFSSISLKDHHAGLLLTLEKQSELLMVNEMPKLFPQWGVQHVRNNYAILFTRLYYHPHDDLVKEKRQLVAELRDACQYESIANLVYLALYPPENQPSDQEAFQESQLVAAKEFQTLADVLVLEYPHTALAAATLTAALDIPWLVVERSQEYSQVKTSYRTAFEAGAAGVVVTAANIMSGFDQLVIEKDELSQPEHKRLENYVKTEARDRLLEIARILEEHRVDES